MDRKSKRQKEKKSTSEKMVNARLDLNCKPRRLLGFRRFESFDGFFERIVIVDCMWMYIGLDFHFDFDFDLINLG